MGGLWGWTYEGDERPHAIVGYEADLTEPDDPWLRLRYSVNGERVDCIVRLVSTRPNYGGRRWWLLCPLVGRRAAKLYLPPGGKLFGSREAYGLTYAFCQASGSPLIASIAADVGASVPRVRRAMRTLGFLGGRPRTGGPVTYGQVGRASSRPRGRTSLRRRSWHSSPNCCPATARLQLRVDRPWPGWHRHGSP